MKRLARLIAPNTALSMVKSPRARSLAGVVGEGPPFRMALVQVTAVPERARDLDDVGAARPVVAVLQPQLAAPLTPNAGQDSSLVLPLLGTASTGGSGRSPAPGGRSSAR